jgi:MraZ protein
VNVLFGQATATLDVKGRISLPAKYRKWLPEEVVIARSPIKEHPALVIYTIEDYNDWLDAVEAGKGGYDATDLSLQDTIEELSEYSEIVRVDNVGRIPIPDRLRKYAQIDREAIFTGARNHLIVRSQVNWEANAKRRERNANVYKDSPG